MERVEIGQRYFCRTSTRGPHTRNHTLPDSFNPWKP
jgi:hypothetical protein